MGLDQVQDLRSLETPDQPAGLGGTPMSTSSLCNVPLVLSLFPGIGLLDRAFEEEGFCIVRGPDLLWGGDIRSFHPPAERFDGVIGGPPCQAFSQLAGLIKHCGRRLAADLIPEFERCVAEAAPAWFLMENVRGAPLPRVVGYQVDAPLYDNRSIGGEQSRVHRFSFGSRDGRSLRAHLEAVALQNPKWAPRVLASGGVGERGADGRPLDERCRGGRLPHDRIRPTDRARFLGHRTARYFGEAKHLQGLPDEWDLPGFTVAAKVRALGNAVPLPMGRAVARAVKAALQIEVHP